MKLLDLFSGIGGFHYGFEKAGYEFDWVGFSEIDKYASAVYRHRYPDAVELGDITSIQPGEHLPKNIDIVCGGFPCQSFSIAGRRDPLDSRGTLIFEIIRILKHYIEQETPIPYVVLENVKGLYSAGNKSIFPAIYGFLTDLGYTVEQQLLNSRWWIPQNRERAYFVLYFGDGSGPKIFPFTEDDFSIKKEQGEKGADGKRTMIESKIIDRKQARREGKVREYLEHSPTLASRDYKEPHLVETGLKQIGNVDTKGHNSIWGRVYDSKGISTTLNSEGGGLGAKTGLYEVRVHNTQTRNPNRPSLTRVCDCGSKKLYKKCCGVDGGGGPLSKKDGTTYCLDTGNTQAVEVTNLQGKDVCNTIRSGGRNTPTDKHNWDMVEIKPVLTPYRLKKRQNGRRFKEDGEDMFTLTQQDQHGVEVKYGIKQLDETLEQNDLDPGDVKVLDIYNRKAQDDCVPLTNANHMPKLYERSQIRRLTPIECMRLQSFPDNWNEYGDFDGEIKPMSDTQRYKQAGNAVTTIVVTAVAEKMKRIMK